MPDITELARFATTPPDEAAKNIENASIFDIEPAAYKGLKDELNAKAEEWKLPSYAPEVVQQFMGQSEDHASLMMPDMENVDYLARQGRKIWQAMTGEVTNDRKLNELRYKESKDPNSLTEDEKLKILLLNEEREELRKNNYGIDGPIESLPAKVAGALSGTAQSMFAGAGADNAPDREFDIPTEFVKKFPLIGPALGMIVGARKDQFKQVAGASYNELSDAVDNDGQPLNIDHTTKRNISYGVGMVTDALETIGGMALAKTTAPFLKKFYSPVLAKQIVTNPANAALMQTLGNVGAAVATESTTEGLQEITSIFGEEIGKTWDGTEASVTSGLINGLSKWQEHAPRVGEAALIGGLAGSAAAVPGGAVGYQGIRSEFQTQRDADERILQRLDHKEAQQSVKALQMREAVTNMVKAASQTKMAEMAPEQLANLEKMIAENAGVKKLWVNGVDLKEWLNDPKKAVIARQIIDKSGVAVEQMNVPVAIEPQEALRIAREHPNLKLVESLQFEPDGPTASQGEAYLNNLEKAEAQRKQVLADLGVTTEELAPEQPSNVTEMPERPKIQKLTQDETAPAVARMAELQVLLSNPEVTPQERTAIETEMNQIRERVKATYRLGPPGDLLVGDWTDPNPETLREDFKNSPLYTKAIEAVVPEAERTKFTDAVNRGKADFLEGVDEAAKLEMNKVQDVMLELAMDEQRQAELERIENDPNYEIVEKFRTTLDPDSKKKRSLYTIDKNFMTDEQIKQFADSEQLKAHKVFGKTGISPDMAAQLMGLPSGDEFLRIMSTTKTREQVVKARTEAKRYELNREVLENVDPNNAKIVRSINNETKRPLELMKWMREKEWPALKSAIKRIALPLPTMKELVYKAYSTIQQTKVGDLNVNQYKVGERKSQRVAVNAILKMELPLAFQALEAQATNLQMQKATLVATSRVNKVINFAKRFDKAKGMNTLKEAGPTYVNAAMEILDVFNLNPNFKGADQDGAFEKYVRSQVAKGNTDIEIPERLSDVRQSINDMTVEQVEAVGNSLREILHQARMKNRLFKKHKKLAEARHMDAIRNETNLKLTLHPGYNPDKIEPIQDTKLPGQGVRGFFRTMGSSFTNMEHILRELDEGKLGGFFQKLLMHPIKGDGEFDQNSGWSKELNMTKAFKNHMVAAIKKYGAKDFDLIESKILNIPEFRGIKALNNGNLTRGDLMTLWAYGGDPYARSQRNKNMGVSDAEFQKVFDRILDPRDVEFMQEAVVDYFKTFREETQELQKRTTGKDVTFVEGIENEYRGKKLPGGYVPVNYKTNLTKKQIDESLKDNRSAFFEGKDIGQVVARKHAAEQTEQGRLIDRTGSKDPVNTSLLRMIRGHEEIIHDLSYREAVMDNLKILRDKGVAGHMIATVGQQKYNTIVNTVIEMANRIEAENASYFSDQSRFFKQMFSRFQSNFSVAMLGFNLTSTAVQYQSLTQVAQNMGAKGLKHIKNVNKKMMMNPNSLPGFYDFANELDPTIGRFVENLQDNVSSTIHKLMPKKGTLGPKMTVAARAHEMGVEAAMSLMSAADVHLKMVSALAGYEQFMAGDVEGYSIDKVMAMTPEARHKAAQAYVRQLSRLSLTHGRMEDKAAFQKNPAAKFFANYWNDLRNVLNNTVNQGRKISWNAEETFEQLRDGDYKNAKTNAKMIGTSVAGLILVSMVSRIIDDMIRDQDNPLDALTQSLRTDEAFDLTTAQGMKDMIEYSAMYALKSPINHTIGSIPFARDINYAINAPRRSDIKTVNIPITKIESDIATTYVAIQELIAGEELSPSQIKAMGYAFSYLAFPLPVNGVAKAIKFLEDRDDDDEVPQKSAGLIENTKEVVAERLENPPPDPDPDFQKELEKLNKMLESESASVPPNTTDILKYAVSNGKWDNYDPETGAAGLYGFTEDQWESISQAAPELGLTENGRVSEDPAQQTKAAQWQAERNAEQLSAKEIPIDAKSLLGSHMIGLENYIKVSGATADQKVKAVFGAAIPAQLQKFKTIGQVREHINSRLVEGQRLYNELTLETRNTED